MPNLLPSGLLPSASDSHRICQSISPSKTGLSKDSRARQIQHNCIHHTAGRELHPAPKVSVTIIAHKTGQLQGHVNLESAHESRRDTVTRFCQGVCEFPLKLSLDSSLVSVYTSIKRGILPSPQQFPRSKKRPPSNPKYVSPKCLIAPTSHFTPTTTKKSLSQLSQRPKFGSIQTYRQN